MTKTITHFMQQKKTQASLLVAISGILYGFLGYLGTLALRENFSVSTMLFWRFFIAAAWMFLVLQYRSCKQTKQIKQTKKMHPADAVSLVDGEQSALFSFRSFFSMLKQKKIWILLLLGGVGYAGSSGFYFLASNYTGTGLAMVIFFAYPLMVALLAWYRHGHAVTTITILSLMVIIVGLLLLRGPADHPIHVFGILFAILSAVFYAFYVVESKSIGQSMDSNLSTLFVCIGAALVCFIAALFTQSFAIFHSLHGLAVMLTFGILATAIPIQLMLQGMKHLSSMRASIISVLEPLVTVFVGVLLLHESMTCLQFLGAIIILGAAVFTQLQKSL